MSLGDKLKGLGKEIGSIFDSDTDDLYDADPTQADEAAFYRAEQKAKEKERKKAAAQAKKEAAKKPKEEPRSRYGKRDDYFEDDFDEPEDEVPDEGGLWPPRTPVRNTSQDSYRRPRNYSTTFIAREFGDAQHIAQTLLNGSPIEVNFAQAAPQDCQRIMDFLCGCIFAIKGTVVPITDYVYKYIPDEDYVPGKPLVKKPQGERNSESRSRNVSRRSGSTSSSNTLNRMF